MTYFIFEIGDELIISLEKTYSSDLLVDVVFAYSPREAFEQYFSRRAA